MASKKQETLYVVGNADIDYFVNFDSCMIDGPEEMVFDKEGSAIEAAKEAFEGNSDLDETVTLVVYKLVPVAKVRRAKAVVEKV